MMESKGHNSSPSEQQKEYAIKEVHIWQGYAWWWQDRPKQTQPLPERSCPMYWRMAGLSPTNKENPLGQEKPGCYKSSNFIPKILSSLWIWSWECKEKDEEYSAQLRKKKKHYVKNMYL